MALGAIVVLVMLAGPGAAPAPRSPSLASESTARVETEAPATNGSFLRTASLQPLTRFAREMPLPRLDGRMRSHDPAQFAGLRALRFDRGRYRPSPIDAKLEFHMTGDSTSVGLGGAVSRLLRHAVK